MSTLSQAKAQLSAEVIADGMSLHIADVNIIDVLSGQVRQRSSVTIQEGRVVAIGQAPAKRAVTISLPDYWVSPSMTEMHAHLTFEPRAHHFGVTFDLAEAPELGLMRSLRNMHEALRAGICIVRDVGGREPAVALLRRTVTSGQFLMPELVTSGAPLCTPGGHGNEFGQLLEETDAANLDDFFVQHRNKGHEWIKIMNGPELWPPDRLDQLVGIAHSQRLQVAIHAFTREGIRDAICAGADTVEHAVVPDRELATMARLKGTAFVPTYYCSWISLVPRFACTQSEYELGILQFWRDYLYKNMPGHLSSGLPTFPGTDAGCAPCTFDDYFEELSEFERLGMSPVEIIRMASIRAAAVLNRERDFGSITVGKWANLIITQDSPLQSVSVLRRPEIVLFKGAEVVNNLGGKWT